MVNETVDKAAADETAEKADLRIMSFARVEAKQARPAVVNEEIRKALRDEKLWWDKLYHRVTAPGVAGSRAFDQAIAVREVLVWDERVNKGRIASFGLTERTLWNHMYSVMKHAGFRVHQGKVTGLLSTENGANGNAEESDDESDESGEGDAS